MSNKVLAEVLHKPIIRNFKKRKVRLSFIENVWVADLAHMQLISKFNKGIIFLMHVIDIFRKQTRFVTLKDKEMYDIYKRFSKKHQISQLINTMIHTKK